MHSIDLRSWFKYLTTPTYRGDDPQNSMGMSITLTNVVSTSFDDPLNIGDVISWAGTTAAGATITIDEFANITLTGTYLAGDTFEYSINAGAQQTYTLG